MRGVTSSLIRVVCISAIVVFVGGSPRGIQARVDRETSCADVNADGAFDVSDVIAILGWLFLGGNDLTCTDPVTFCGDANGDMTVDLSDAVTILNWLFIGSAEPACSRTCEEDPREIDGFSVLGCNAQGYPEYRHEQTGIIFVLLPGGAFFMGAQGEDPAGRNYDPDAQEDEGPVHEVTLSPFLIAKYEVTRKEWNRVMDDPLMNPNWPVEVSWVDIQDFEEKTGLTLPTEAQWEYACRAGTEGPYSGTGDLDDMGWYYRNSEEGRLQVVGGKLPNQFGLHDMHGNVAEWCEDVMDSGFYSSTDAVRPDPICAEVGRDETRVFRGGGIESESAEGCRSSSRDGHSPSSLRRGFRPARLVEQEVEIDRERLDFGYVALGRSGRHRLEIRNIGFLPLEFASIRLSGETSGEYEITEGSNTASIPPGGGLELEVTYTPVNTLSDRGALVIESNDRTEPTMEIRLLGAGIEPPEALELGGWSSLGANAKGFPEYRHEQTGIVFVLLPGGTFLMGAQGQDVGGPNYDLDAYENEGPVHEVTLSPFLMGKYEVTQGEWVKVMGSNPSRYQGQYAPAGVDTTRLPVENLSWSEIQEFEKLTKLTLPSEAQWEYACRAGVEGPTSGTGILDDMAWYWRKYNEDEGGTRVVGSKAPNQFGLHDMQGNVEELCKDVYHVRFYEMPEASILDPVSSESSEAFLKYQVVRGGSFFDEAVYCRSGRRGLVRDYDEATLGFRIMKRLEQKVELERERVDFGAVPLGRSWSVRLGIRNLGLLPLEITSIEIPGALSSECEILEAPDVVPPDGRVEILLRYTPADAGSDRGTLVIETNDRKSPRLEVRLLGTTIELPQAITIEGFTALGPNDQGFPEYRHDQQGIIFVLLPGGTFLMGAQGEDPEGPNYDPEARSAEGPVHEVPLSPFLMAKYEVTQRQWLEVMGYNPSWYQPGQREGDRLPPELLEDERWLDLPIDFVSWDDIQSFEEKTGLQLPTEAQWEYACRGGVEGSISGTNELNSMAWYHENSNIHRYLVGTKAPNQFGLHDMHGNVAEWCEDVYDSGFYQKPEASGLDPVATSGSDRRVVRGGFRAAERRFITGGTGFRLAVALP